MINPLTLKVMTLESITKLWSEITGNPELKVGFNNKAKTWVSVWPIAPKDLSSLIRYYDYNGRLLLTTEWMSKDGYHKTGVKMYVPSLVAYEAKR